MPLLIFIGVQACLYFFVEKYYILRLNKKDKRVCLLDKPEPGISSKFTQFIEYAILARYSFFGYKNSVRSNLRIFPAISLTTFLYIFLKTLDDYIPASFQLLENKNEQVILAPSLLIAILGFCISAFILERGHLHKKWEYLASIYNKVIETERGLKRDIIEAALVLDMIEMEMWSHKSYRGIFKSILTIAYSTTCGEYPFKTNNLKYTEADISTKLFDKQDAYKVIENYQKILMNRQRVESFKRAS